MSVFTNFAAKKFVKSELGKRFAQEDPWYQEVTVKNGKRKKIKKVPIAGLSEKDAKILKGVKRRAWIFDLAFNLGCGRFGVNAVVGLIPWVGDLIALLLDYWVVTIAKEANLPATTVAAMHANIAVDFGIGLVPVFGSTLGSAIYKCNVRNTVLLEKHLRQRAEANLRVNEPQITTQEESTIKRWIHSVAGNHHPEGSTHPAQPTQASSPSQQVSGQESGVYYTGSTAMQ
jgi:hypothetical protein